MGTYVRTAEHRRRISEAQKGNKHWLGKRHRPETLEKMSKVQKGLQAGEKHPNFGKRRPQAFRDKISGKNHWHWKGGLTSEYKRIRDSIEYKDWRKAVYERDLYSCRKCGDNKGGNLHPHHILNFETYVDLRLNVDNGVTLCDKCHIKFHRTYGYSNNTTEQNIEYLNEREGVTI